MAEPAKPPPAGLTSSLHAWGTSTLPPVGLATLIFALHAKPLQPLPLVFVPVLYGATYMNLAGYPTDSAATTAAWSGLYALLALRRSQKSLRARFSARGGVRLVAVALGVANCVAGGWVWLSGDRKRDELERRNRNRWGQFDNDD